MRPSISCIVFLLLNCCFAALAPAAEPAKRPPTAVYVVPNFHPASCGWLTDWSTERNYCANSYLAHLDRVRDDPRYAFALSEVNNLMAIMAFSPDRIPELQQRIKEGRAELVNAFFLEPTINLSGGEALVKMGVEGLRWQSQMMGVRPRAAWMIDVTGVHEQMAQIVAGLGLDAIVYTRDNPTGKTLHWLQSPDGSKALAVCPGHYSEWGPVFTTRTALGDAAVKQLAAQARAKSQRTPAGAPVLILGGGGDYSLPPAFAPYPGKFLDQIERAAPDLDVRFTTLGQYLDAILPGIRSGKIELPISRSGAKLSWTSFWIQNPEVKQRYRRAEHALQAAEAAATIASLTGKYEYPVQKLYGAWLEMLLNMDRNTLWGAAGGMVFEHPTSWDVKDRFDSVDGIAWEIQDAAVQCSLNERGGNTLLNPLGWRRKDPFVLPSLNIRSGPTGLCGVPCQFAPGGLIVEHEMPSFGAELVELETVRSAARPQVIPGPASIENRYYSAKVDTKTGALISLKLKPSGREMLAGPVQLVAESGLDGHNTPPRPKRKRLADSGQFPAYATVSDGPIATVVEMHSSFYGGGRSRQVIYFYKNSPRIDFDTEINDIPNATVIVAEFPLKQEIREIRRGIPYGISHAAWSVPNPDLPGYGQGIQAAIRWSHYQFTNGGGVAILDRGLPGRELNGQTPVVFLLNAQDTYLGYPCAWLSGKGKHRASYALVAHEGNWNDARVPQMAWEFNCPPVLLFRSALASPLPLREGQGVRAARASYLETSPNIIVEALRREGDEIELRFAECLGLPGTAEIELKLPHGDAFQTDLVGGNRQPLGRGPKYQIPVRPQQIVTLRLKTETAVPAIQPLLKWDELVPAPKLKALRQALPGKKGHPPKGSGVVGTAVPTLPPDAAKSLTLNRPAVASNIYKNQPAHAAAMAVDGDENTRWATDANVSRATLDVDLGKPQEIGRAYLSEGWDRVRKFELQYQRGGKWETFARGEKIGTNLSIKFPPVTAQRVRLNITDAPGGPTIWEFMLFPPSP